MTETETIEDAEFEVKDEDVEQARNLPAVQAAEAMVVRGEVTPDDVVAQRDKIKQVMSAVMENGVHYGEIPGIKKPTLLKPGAEVLAVTLRLAPHYESERTFHDDGHLTVVSKVRLVHIPSGLTIAEGEGLCTSREKKYAYRGSGRVCPSCGEAGTIKRSRFAPKPSDYPGASSDDPPGWYCYSKVGGCGANFAASDSDITSQEEKPVPNPDLPDTFNTVLKMANKRALIAAILNGTAASDIFTQDVEDADADGRQAQAAVRQEREPVRKDVQIPVPRSFAEVKQRVEYALGEQDAAVWLAQAKTVGEKMTSPTFFQRMCGVVVDIDTLGWGEVFPPPSRSEIQDVFAKRLDGVNLEGPEWVVGSGDAETEKGRPQRGAEQKEESA